MRFFWVSCCFGLLYLPGVAAEQWIVPGATNVTAANGLAGATDLKLYNPGFVTASVTLDLVAEVGDPAAASVPQSIAPGQTLVLPDVLQTVWGLTGSSGAVRITADQQLVIAANVCAVSEDSGSYCFEVDAIPYERWTTAGATVHTAWISQSADPAVGFASTLGIVFAAPNTAVDVRVFDSAGNQVARRQFTAGVAEQRIALSSLAAGDLPVGRAEFYVTSGRALAYALVADNVTGDSLISTGLPDAAQSLDAVCNGVIKASSAAPRTQQSDLRVFNLSTGRPATVFVSVLSSTVASLIGRNASITVPPAGMQELPDALGQLFQAPDGAVAALRVTSAQPAIVMARTATVNTDGTPGTFGALQTPVATADFLQGAGIATLIGLRADADTGTAANLSLLAGPDGASANLNLSGPDGESLGSTSVALGAWQRQDMALPDLFSGISVPDDSRVDIQMTAGELSGFAQAADIASGDTWIQPATPQQSYFCPAPAIVSFSAQPNTVPAGGSSTLYWSAANADTVAISPGVATPALSGSAVLRVNATTAYTIIATGPCGTASQTAVVAVGAPAIASLSPAAAAPGQIVTLRLRNISDPSVLRQVNVVFSKSLTLGVEIEGVTASGDVTIRVPFVGDTTDPAGHLTGAVTIALALPGAGAGTPFTIQALKYAGADAVADLRSLTSAAVQLVKVELTGQQSVPEFAAATPRLLALVDQYAAVLNKLASDIAATGTAGLPMVPPSGSAPAASVTVTRKQLELFFALYYSMTGAAAGSLPPISAGLQPRSLAPSAASSSGPCLTDNAAYKSCLDLVGSDPFEPFQKIFLELVQHSSYGNCTFSGINSAISIIDSYLSRLFRFPLFNCYTQPTQIEGFKAQPAPDPIPAGTRNGGTRITARLSTLFDSFNFAVAPYGEALLALNTLPATCQSQIQNAVDQAFDSINKEAVQIVQDLVNSGAWKISPSADVPVYKCDVADLSPDDPSRLGRRADWDNDPALRFGLEGYKSGPASLRVLYNLKHFMRLDDWDTKKLFRTRYLEQDPAQAKIATVSVNVLGGKRLTVDQSLQNIGVFAPDAAITPNQVVTFGADFTVPLLTGTFGIGPNNAAYETHSVTQTSDTTWQIQISQGGGSQGRVSVDFSNPQNRNNTQHIVIQANAAGNCGMYFTAKAVDPAGKIIGPSYSLLHVDPQSFTIDAPGAVAGGVFLEIDGVSGSSCVANATIQLLDQ